MQMFSLTLSQMLMMFTLMAVGFILRKKNIVAHDAYVTLSKLETFALVPALTFHNQLTNCTVENFKKHSPLMLYGLALVLVAIVIGYFLSGIFVRNSKESSALAYKRCIYKYALTFGNYGFMGNFIILGVWGDAAFFRYSMFTFFVAIFCSAYGLYILIPKEENASFAANLKKGLLAPPVIALVLGMICGLLNLGQYFPEFALTALKNAGNCMGPVAMLLAGMVIGGYNFTSLLKNKLVYAATFVRLIVLPAIFVTVLRLIGTSQEIMTLALIAFGTPLGMNTIVYPAAYGGETKTGASMTMISHVLSVITIPIMYLIFIELL